MSHQVSAENRHKTVSMMIGVAAVMFMNASLNNVIASDAVDRAAAVRSSWNAADRGVLASLRLSQLPPTPRDPSNAVESSPWAIELGKRLFDDKRLSRNQSVSCASCHDSEKQFQDGLPVAHGVGIGTRRTMPVVNSGYSPWLFWDGRKDSLWAQALGPLEDAVEHGGTRTRYAHLIRKYYRAEYEAIFRSIPDLQQVPGDAGPSGTSTEKVAWSNLDAQTQADVNRIFANIGKAIAAYEKTLAYGESRFDRYVDNVIRGVAGTQQVLTQQEIRGLRLFIGKGQCVSCHNGPLFTDQQFHNTGVPPRDAAMPDQGRAVATALAMSDEFNCLGQFSDAEPAQCQELRFMVTDDPSLAGAFKTPGLRGVTLRPPYMHAGQFGSVEEVITHYVRAPVAVIGRSELARDDQGRTERKQIRLSVQEVTDLAAFLGTLSSSIMEVASQ